jgi:hypothetical protein
VGRFSLKFAGSLPTGAIKAISYWGGNNGGTVSGYRLEFDPSDNKLKVSRIDGAGVRTSTSTGPEIVADTQYLIDFRNEGALLTWDWMVDGVAQPQLTDATSFLHWVFGINASQTFSCYIDDIALVYNSTSGEDATVRGEYPLTSSGYVRALYPTSNGPNNTESAFSTSSGTIADSWQLLADFPLATTTGYIQQDSTDTAAYVQYGFEALGANESPANDAVAVVGEVRTGSALGNNAELHLIDGAGDLVVYDGIWSGSGVNWVAPTLFDQAFTKASVDALGVRWGYSSDASPIPRNGGLLLEVFVTTEEELEAYWGVGLQ